MALAIMGVITLMSFIVAPIFRSRMNEQFLLGARNQAFTTEYVGGIETVKSLQMEPQLSARYSDYLAEYLQEVMVSGLVFCLFRIAGSYGVRSCLLPFSNSMILFRHVQTTEN